MTAWIQGECWRCDASDLPVVWVGPAQWEGQHAPIFLCAPCLTAIENRTRSYFLSRRPDPAAVTVYACDYVPAWSPHPRRTLPMQHDKAGPLGKPLQIQTVSISISGLGFRARANGRTGREAWQLLRRRHPRVALAAAALIVTLAALALWRLV